MIFQAGRNDLGLPLRRYSRQPEKDDPFVDPVLPKNQLTEVLVRSNQERAGIAGGLQHELVIDPGIELRDVDHIVPILTQTLDDLPVDSFVGNEPHAASWGSG